MVAFPNRNEKLEYLRLAYELRFTISGDGRFVIGNNEKYTVAIPLAEIDYTANEEELRALVKERIRERNPSPNTGDDFLRRFESVLKEIEDLCSGAEKKPSDSWKNAKSWGKWNDPATPKQLRLLSRLGVSPSPGLTKGEASKLLDDKLASHGIPITHKNNIRRNL